MEIFFFLIYFYGYIKTLHKLNNSFFIYLVPGSASFMLQHTALETRLQRSIKYNKTFRRQTTIFKWCCREIPHKGNFFLLMGAKQSSITNLTLTIHYIYFRLLSPGIFKEINLPNSILGRRYISFSVIFLKLINHSILHFINLSLLSVLSFNWNFNICICVSAYYISIYIYYISV